MLTGKRFRLLIGIFLVIVAMIAFYGPAKADDDFDQNFLYLPQILAPDVSSFIGAVTYKIPIQVPQGRGGIQPSINLYYNSFVGNGWIGVGWDLNMGYIQRSTKYGASYACDPGSWSSTKCGTNYEKSDFFVSANGSSSELVIRPNWDSGNHTYGKKIEQDFSKYYFNSTTRGWEVTDKQGTVHYYGSTSASRLYNSFGTFRWFFDKVQDVYGNYMTLSYYNDSANGQLYLQEIDYTANGSLSYSNKVVFTLSSQARTAADTPVSYASKAQVSTAYRLRSISVFTSVNNKWQLVSKYALTYTQSGDTSRSLLKQVIQYGSDGATTRSVLPDNAFTYQSCGNKFVGEVPISYTGVASTQKITWATSGLTGIVFDDNPSGSTGNIVTNNGNATRTAAYNANYQSFWLANLNLSGNPDIVYVDNQSPPHIHSIT
ncbi:MAG TPA: SpvB/TcaC N-terminal domain-containing protein, partial [Syntrophobacteraceae bacterium]|nr:SpvB/TcaC N-terminal domain-containing protein [Syntrophobacteraceae bacterium]